MVEGTALVTSADSSVARDTPLVTSASSLVFGDFVLAIGTNDPMFGDSTPRLVPGVWCLETLLHDRCWRPSWLFGV